MFLKGEIMKLSVSIRKTVQESAYEPFSVELSLEKDILDNTKETKIFAEHEGIALLLQAAIENIFEERRKE